MHKLLRFGLVATIGVFAVGFGVACDDDDDNGDTNGIEDILTPSDGVGTPVDGGGLGTPADGLGTPAGGLGTPADGLGTPADGGDLLTPGAGGGTEEGF